MVLPRLHIVLVALLLVQPAAAQARVISEPGIYHLEAGQEYVVDHSHFDYLFVLAIPKEGSSISVGILDPNRTIWVIDVYRGAEGYALPSPHRDLIALGEGTLVVSDARGTYKILGPGHHLICTPFLRRLRELRLDVTVKGGGFHNLRAYALLNDSKLMEIEGRRAGNDVWSGEAEPGYAVVTYIMVELDLDAEARVFLDLSGEEANTEIVGPYPVLGFVAALGILYLLLRWLSRRY